jgi:hypothetical protein
MVGDFRYARDANSFTWGPDGWLYGCQGVLHAFNGLQTGHSARGARQA